MSDTHALPPAPVASPSAVLWRITWPFFLFSAALLVVMGLSWTYLLPRYTKVDVNGVARTADEIREAKSALTAQIASLESERKDLVLAVTDREYDALKEQRRERRPLNELRAMLRAHAAEALAGKGAVHFRGFAYDPAGKTLVVRGDVRDAGVSSMTTLVGYVEALRGHPEIASVTTPSFAREDAPGIGLHSPFEITLTLK